MAIAEEVGRRSRVRAFRFPRARAEGSRLVGLPLGVWIELDTMPERGRPHRKSNENQWFFIIFNMEASKTNGFSTFWFGKLQKPKVFQWFWLQGSQPEPTGLDVASRAKLGQPIRPGRALQADVWSFKTFQTMRFSWFRRGVE